MKKRIIVLLFVSVLIIPLAFAADYQAGDIDANGKININDPVYLLNYLFQNGKEPSCISTADANSDGVIDITDALFLLNFLFLGGEEPTGRVLGFACNPTIDENTISIENSLPNNIKSTGRISCGSKESFSKKGVNVQNNNNLGNINNREILIVFEVDNKNVYPVGRVSDGIPDKITGNPVCPEATDPLIIFYDVSLGGEVVGGQGGNYIAPLSSSGSREVLDFEGADNNLDWEELDLQEKELDFEELANEEGSNDISIKGGDENDNIIKVENNKEEIHGLGGNDVISVEHNLPYARIYGDEGNDVIEVKENNYDTNIYGDEGNDVINVETNKGSINGDQGNDVINVEASTAGVIHGDEGNDVIEVKNHLRSNRYETHIHGGGGNDVIDVETNKGETHGDGGNDVISAGYNFLGKTYGDEGNDFILGRVNNDHIEGGSGNDFILTGLDKDNIAGGTGNDIIIADWDISEILNHISKKIGEYYTMAHSGKQIDANVLVEEIKTKYETPIKEKILSGSIEEPNQGGNDILFGNSGEGNPDEEDNDIIFGMGGDDVIYGDEKIAGDDWLFGGSGNDRLEGGYGNDVVSGGNGNDNLYGDTEASPGRYIPGRGLILDDPDSTNGFDILCGQRGRDVLYSDDFSRLEANNFMATGPREDKNPESVFCNPKVRSGFDTIALFNDVPLPEDEVKKCIRNLEAFGVSASESGWDSLNIKTELPKWDPNLNFVSKTTIDGKEVNILIPDCDFAVEDLPIDSGGSGRPDSSAGQTGEPHVCDENTQICCQRNTLDEAGVFGLTCRPLKQTAGRCLADESKVDIKLCNS